MQRFSGSWIGSGKLLFGAEPRPEFACELKGDPGESQLTFGLSGQCRMGMMSAPVFAQLHYDAKTKRFYGQFMDGAAGNGVDIVGARAGEGFSLKLLAAAVVQGRLTAPGDQPGRDAGDAFPARGSVGPHRCDTRNDPDALEEWMKHSLPRRRRARSRSTTRTSSRGRRGRGPRRDGRADAVVRLPRSRAITEGISAISPMPFRRTQGRIRSR